MGKFLFCVVIFSFLVFAFSGLEIDGDLINFEILIFQKSKNAGKGIASVMLYNA